MTEMIIRSIAKNIVAFHALNHSSQVIKMILRF